MQSQTKHQNNIKNQIKPVKKNGKMPKKKQKILDKIQSPHTQQLSHMIHNFYQIQTTLHQNNTKTTNQENQSVLTTQQMKTKVPMPNGNIPAANSKYSTTLQKVEHKKRKNKKKIMCKDQHSIVSVATP